MAGLEALRRRVAVAAGATRGAGRGIAAALGEAGATVICTGRSTRAQGSSRSDYDRPERLEDTAELVTRLGGNGIAIAVDHLNSVEVEQLADHIRRTQGHFPMKAGTWAIIQRLRFSCSVKERLSWRIR